jgi:hypothetical protein
MNQRQLDARNVPVPATTQNNEQVAGQHPGEHRNRFVLGYMAYAALFTRIARKTSSAFFQKMSRSEVRTCARYYQNGPDSAVRSDIWRQPELPTGLMVSIWGCRPRQAGVPRAFDGGPPQ